MAENFLTGEGYIKRSNNDPVLFSSGLEVGKIILFTMCLKEILIIIKLLV